MNIRPRVQFRTHGYCKDAGCNHGDGRLIWRQQKDFGVWSNCCGVGVNIKMCCQTAECLILKFILNQVFLKESC